MPGRVAGRDGAGRGVAAVLALGQRERRLEPGQRLGARVAARVLVLGDDGLATLGVGDGDWRQLGLEAAGIDGRDRLLVAGERKGVLVLAAHVVLDGDPFGVGAHVAVLDRAPQAVGDGRIDQFGVAEPEPETRARQEVGRPVHRLHAARDHDLRVAGSDLRGGEHDRLQARPADPVDRRGAGRVWQACLEGRLPCRRLTRSGLQHLAHQHVIDLDGRRIEARPLDRGTDRDAAERRRRHG